MQISVWVLGREWDTECVDFKGVLKLFLKNSYLDCQFQFSREPSFILLGHFSADLSAIRSLDFSDIKRQTDDLKKKKKLEVLASFEGKNIPYISLYIDLSDTYGTKPEL